MECTEVEKETEEDPDEVVVIVERGVGWAKKQESCQNFLGLIYLN